MGGFCGEQTLTPPPPYHYHHNHRAKRLYNEKMIIFNLKCVCVRRAVSEGNKLNQLKFIGYFSTKIHCAPRVYKDNIQNTSNGGAPQSAMIFTLYYMLEGIYDVGGARNSGEEHYNVYHRFVINFVKQIFRIHWVGGFFLVFLLLGTITLTCEWFC